MSKSHHILTSLPSFIQGIVVAYYQSRQALKEEGLKGILRPRFFWKRKAIPVEMDLSTIPSQANLLRDARYQFVELKLEDLLDGNLLFLLPSRRMKAHRNLKRGWRGFALVNGSEVIGDVWFISPVKRGRSVTHPDLRMLGITCSDKDAYAFDMYISLVHRGENLAAPFQRLLQAKLKEEGWQKVYGYYWDDNLPALWMHRVLKFKELPKRQVSRFLFCQMVNTITETNHLDKTSNDRFQKEHQAAQQSSAQKSKADQQTYPSYRSEKGEGKL